MWRITAIWDWLWYYRRGKIKYNVYDYGDTYMATASNGKITVLNFYGSTEKSAKEMALWKLKQTIQASLNDEDKNYTVIHGSKGTRIEIPNYNK